VQKKRQKAENQLKKRRLFTSSKKITFKRTSRFDKLTATSLNNCNTASSVLNAIEKLTHFLVAQFWEREKTASLT